MNSQENRWHNEEGTQIHIFTDRSKKSNQVFFGLTDIISGVNGLCQYELHASDLMLMAQELGLSTTKPEGEVGNMLSQPAPAIGNVFYAQA